MNISGRFFLLALMVAISISALPAQAAETESASTSKLTGTSFGATPERDLRPIAISTCTTYLDQGAKLSNPAAKISDVEVIFWRGATNAQAVTAYQKLVTDNLAQGGFIYQAADPQTANAITTTRFQAASTQQGLVIGYWQTSSQGMYLNWGRVTGGAAPAAPADKAAGQPANPVPAASDKDAQIAELKRKLADAEAAKTGTVTPTAVPDTAAVPAAGPVAAQSPDDIPSLPLEQSDLVTKRADGALVVANKDGSGFDGVKLSKHDLQMGSPSVAVAPEGTIHVVFNEMIGTTLAHAIYHCSSSDGGKTWTEPKNLTEELPGPGFDVGHCQVLADAQNRVYVIWRAGLRETWMVSVDPAGEKSDLWFRELDGGKWSKAKIFNEPVGAATPNDAPRSFFGAVDAAGRAQVIWNVQPDTWHPELIINGQHQPGVGAGLVFQCDLDGATSSKPREVFLPVIGGMDKGARSSPSCDELDTLNGYFDSAGAAHFVAAVTGMMYGINPHRPDYELMENGKTVQAIKLPELSFHGARDIPTLLVDAKGKRHLIAMYLGGEHPDIRDYLLGSDDEPTVIRAAVGLHGVIDGFQAYQGPGGRMTVLMQMNDTGDMHAGDNFVSTSTGDGKWSTPVNITNNAGRKTFHNTQTSSQSNVAELTSCIAGAGAIAFDRDGHLLVVAVKGEYKMVLATAFGVNTAGGDTVTPTLRFLKF